MINQAANTMLLVFCVVFIVYKKTRYTIKYAYHNVFMCLDFDSDL